MRKNYIRVEEISLTRLNHAEFINFMQRVRALLPIVKDEESRDAAPALAITADQVAELDGYLQTMSDLTRESQVKAETKPKKEIDRLRDSLIAYKRNARLPNNFTSWRSRIMASANCRITRRRK